MPFSAERHVSVGVTSSRMLDRDLMTRAFRLKDEDIPKTINRKLKMSRSPNF